MKPTLGLFLIILAAGLIAWAGGTSGAVVLTIVILASLVLLTMGLFERNSR
jgi:hypothetical protein